MSADPPDPDEPQVDPRAQRLIAAARVTVHELQLHAHDLVRRAALGEQITITRKDKPVAELHPASVPALRAADLLARWRGLPAVDPRRPGADLDDVLNRGL